LAILAIVSALTDDTAKAIMAASPAPTHFMNPISARQARTPSLISHAARTTNVIKPMTFSILLLDAFEREEQTV
jgi:hypothetical protein